MNQTEFIKITLPLEHNLFKKFYDQINFKSVGKGRLGNHLVKISEKGIPIVRTTTQYNIPAHNFTSLHNSLIDCINLKLDNLTSINFNNALIEVYDSNYTKMKYHSDQCIDLAPNSFIGLFSCYENPTELTAQSIRKLKIKDKITDEEFEISLEHNSLVLFSLSANSRYFHKIVLEQIQKKEPLLTENKWLGITFRESKTYIQFKDNLPYFEDGELLKLASDEQITEYFKLRGEENRSMNFIYPKIDYTLSTADTIKPIKEK